MPNFISGLPATGTPLVSAEIRNNFLALNARTDKLTPRATVPASTKVNIGAGTIYFADHVQVRFSGQQIDLGDSLTGVSAFNNIGFFKDIVVVLRQQFNAATNRHSAIAIFLEGPEKASSTIQPDLVQIASTDIPIAAFVVRHNGLNLGIAKGQIEPIPQTNILDIRNFVDAGGITYFSTTVGDRIVEKDEYGTVVLDSNGLAEIQGETTGVHTGIINGVHPIQRAIDEVHAQGGGTVFLRRGHYTPSSTIVIYDNVQLLGEGKNTVIERSDTFGGPLFKLTGDHASINNLFIQGPSTHVYAYGPLLELSEAKYCSIQNCIIDATAVTAIGVMDLSTRNTIVNNFIIQASVATFIEAGCSKNLIVQNQIDNTTTPFQDESLGANNPATSLEFIQKNVV